MQAHDSYDPLLRRHWGPCYRLHKHSGTQNWAPYDDHHPVQLGLCGWNDIFHSQHSHAVSSLVFNLSDADACSFAHRLGFSVTAVILGGQTLASVNPGTLPLVVGIIIIGILSLIPCFIGYNYVHYYERYAWIVIFVIIMFLWSLGGHAGFDVNAQKPLEDRDRALSADILSFGGIVFGSFTGVCTRAPCPCIALLTCF